MGDPLTRPAERVAMDVRRKLVMVEGARNGYGVLLDTNGMVCTLETEELRADMRSLMTDGSIYDRGGNLDELRVSCLQETGLAAPMPPWEAEPYGPHTGLEYVEHWYATMQEARGWELE